MGICRIKCYFLGPQERFLGVRIASARCADLAKPAVLGVEDVHVARRVERDGVGVVQARLGRWSAISGEARRA
jgi:hypothetical protein